MLEMGLDARERLRDLARLLIKEEKVALTSSKVSMTLGKSSWHRRAPTCL